MPGRESVIADDPPISPARSWRCCVTRTAAARSAQAGRRLVEEPLFLGAGGRSSSNRSVERGCRRSCGIIRPRPSVVLICHENDRLDCRGARRRGWRSTYDAGRSRRRSVTTRRGSGAWRAAKSAARLAAVSPTLSRSGCTRGMRLAGRDRRGRTSELSRLRARYPADLRAVPHIVVTRSEL